MRARTFTLRPEDKGGDESENAACTIEDLAGESRTKGLHAHTGDGRQRAKQRHRQGAPERYGRSRMGSGDQDGVIPTRARLFSPGDSDRTEAPGALLIPRRRETDQIIFQTRSRSAGSVLWL